MIPIVQYLEKLVRTFPDIGHHFFISHASFATLNAPMGRSTRACRFAPHWFEPCPVKRTILFKFPPSALRTSLRNLVSYRKDFLKKRGFQKIFAYALFHFILIKITNCCNHKRGRHRHDYGRQLRELFAHFSRNLQSQALYRYY